MANIIDYIPPVLHDIKDVKYLCKSLDTELDRLLNAFDKTYDNQYFDTMDDATCTRLEKIIGIEYDSTYTLEERRARIKSRFVEQLPYTKATLKHVLTTMCGEDGFYLYVDNSTYTVHIKLALSNKRIYSDVVDTIQRIIPANMMLDVSIMYNTHETLSHFTHEKLENYTHEQLYDEVIK